MSRFMNVGQKYINVSDIKSFRVNDCDDTIVITFSGEEYIIHRDVTKDILECSEGQVISSALESISDSLGCIQNSIDNLTELVDSCIVQDRNANLLHIGGIVAKL